MPLLEGGVVDGVVEGELEFLRFIFFDINAGAEAVVAVVVVDVVVTIVGVVDSVTTGVTVVVVDLVVVVVLVVVVDGDGADSVIAFDFVLCNLAGDRLRDFPSSRLYVSNIVLVRIGVKTAIRIVLSEKNNILKILSVAQKKAGGNGKNGN